MNAVAAYPLWPITRPGARPVAGAWNVLRASGEPRQRPAPDPTRPNCGAATMRYDASGRILETQRLGKGFFIDILT